MFPKHVFRPAKNAKKFLAVIVTSQEHLDSLEEEHGEHHDSPADFGVETHPNPHEKRLAKPSKPEGKPEKPSRPEKAGKPEAKPSKPEGNA